MDDVREAFEWYADWAADVSPLYERLARGVLDEPALLAVAAEAPEGQPPPQLLLGAVHARLLGGADHPLADFYPTCTDDPLDPATTDPLPSFREFVLAREAAVRDVVASRRVQTNEVGRAAVLLPAFEHVSRAASGDGSGSADDGSRTAASDAPPAGNRTPLALVEVGASAGLNLRWDGYRYEYAGAGRVGGDDEPGGADDHVVCGPRDAPVTVESAVRGDRDPPLPTDGASGGGGADGGLPGADGGLPPVAARAGVDLNPLDVTDPEDALWLRALVIPDQRERHERLAAAVAAAREDPPELVAGDALDVLPDLLSTVPEDATVCVFSTLTLYQLAADEVAALRGLLAERSRRRDRPVHWLSADPAADLDDLAYRHVRFDGGEATETRLAEHESYGAWVRWLADRDASGTAP